MRISDWSSDVCSSDLTTQFVAPPEADAASAYTKKVVKRKIADGYRIARKQVGDPYRAGGDGPSSFDCSGLVQYSFKKAGFNVPRTTYQQAKYARKKIGRAHV